MRVRENEDSVSDGFPEQGVEQPGCVLSAMVECSHQSEVDVVAGSAFVWDVIFSEPMDVVLGDGKNVPEEDIFANTTLADAVVLWGLQIYCCRFS
jgi:hypothetical protein